MLLEVRNIVKTFDDQPVLRGVSLSVQAGEIVTLLGPSGCGKTTLLRIMAGLEQADRGQLLLEGRDLFPIPVHVRGFGLVFQDYALFPHKNVADNIGFGLRMLGWPAAERESRVEQVLELVGLAGFGARAVYELSGGEQQRVALARSLAPAPRLLLLDEPLGALDRALRERLMGELRSILKRAGAVLSAGEPETTAMTSIYVTHDQEEAFAVADRVIVMNSGQVEQTGTPVELYRFPQSPFVARFLGMHNLIDATVVSRRPLQVSTRIGILHLDQPQEEDLARPILLIRPEAASLLGDRPLPNSFAGRLTNVSFRGRYQLATIVIERPDGMLELKLAFDSSIKLPHIGDSIQIALKPEELILLPGDVEVEA